MMIMKIKTDVHHFIHDTYNDYNNNLFIAPNNNPPSKIVIKMMIIIVHI